MVGQPHITAPRLAGLLACMALAAGCAPGLPEADKIELATIYPWNEMPKSAPRQFVRSFERFCEKGPTTIAGRDAALRDASYVPHRQPTERRAGVYVVDDKRPAVISGSRLCGVRAVSRTGQTQAVQSYIRAAYPKARPMNREEFPAEVEQAWQIDGGILATTRNDWVGNDATYTLVLFRPGA